MRFRYVLAFSSMLACVGDTQTASVGTLGGLCYPNQTCIAGLACVNGTCVASDGGAGDASQASDAPNEATSGDGGIDTQSDPNNCGSIGRVCPSAKCKAGDCVRRVFVTGGTTKGTFGGASGADNLCNVSAQGVATLKGTYYAWLSTSSSSPQTHFTKGTAPYVLVDGTTVVANDFTQLASGTLAHAIDTDETGTNQPNVNVWTGTHADGTEAGPPNCSDFSANPSDANATIGSSSMTNTTWTESTTLGCTTFAHVYCVEQ